MTNSQFRMSAAEAEQPPVVTATGDIDLANVNEFSGCPGPVRPPTATRSRSTCRT